MDNVDPTAIATLVQERKWVPLAAVAIWLAMQLVKDDNRFPVSIPARYRVWLLPALGVLSGVLDHVVAGESWASAAAGAAVSVLMAMFFHEGVVESIREGKNLPLPGLTIPGTRPAPGKPVTVPPPPAAEPEVLPDPPETKDGSDERPGT